MATTADTSDRDNSHGRTTEVEQQLGELVELFEEINWSDVEGLTVAEAATLGQKFANARQRTMSADGGL
jgi:hypothetical protein